MNPRSSYPHQLLVRFLLAGAFALIGVHTSAQTGRPWAWGYNKYGELGDGTNSDRYNPVQAPNHDGVVQVAMGYVHTLVLKSDGTVWASGYNGHGELGDGTTTDKNAPIMVSGLSGVVQIAAGSYQSFAIKFDGTVWAWGDNESGQLGDGTTTNRTVPVQVVGVSRIVQVAAGGWWGNAANAHTLMLKSDGTVWGCGWNVHGQLGDGTTNNRSVPAQIASLSGVTQISAGAYHSIALKSNGTVWSWGFNDQGELGNGNGADQYLPVQSQNLSNIVQVAGGSNHTLALKSDGTVWAIGGNNEGELGDGTTTSESLAIQVPNVSSVVQVATGAYHSLALKSDGTVWVWGWNGYGQLGDGTTSRRPSAIQVAQLQGQTYLATGSSAYHSLALTAVVTDTLIASSKTTAVYAKPFNISATLSDQHGFPLIHRPVSFSIGGTSVGTAYTDTSGKATIAMPVPAQYPVGTYNFTANFAGDRLYNASTPSTGVITITMAGTRISVSRLTIQPGQTINLTGILRRVTDNAPVPAEDLIFRLNWNILGTVATDGTGKASLAFTGDEALSIGAHTLFVEFDGDDNYDVALVKTTLTVAQAPTKMTGNSVSGKAGTTVTLKARVVRTTDKAGLGNRTLTFQIDGATVGSGTTDATGVATVTYAIPAGTATGTHTITALYAGETFYLGSSVVTTLTVK